MKRLLNQFASRRAFRLGVPLTTTLLLLAALPVAAADTPYTATGWVIGVPVPGIWCTNALGQVGFRGNVHLARVVGTDALLTGRRTIFVDGDAQTDGSSIIYGPAYQEVGTWDGTGTNFTATGGMWEISYRGTMGTDGSLQLHLVGSGWGGTIDGLRLDETLTRTNGPTLDPTIPYLYTGTIKPAPLDTTVVIDNFNNPPPPYWSKSGSATLIETNGQLTVRGYWPGIHTVNLGDTVAWASPDRPWVVTQGHSLEARLDLVSLKGVAPAAVLAIYHDVGVGYWMSKGTNYISVGKQNGGQMFLSADRLTTMNTNEVLVLALTPAGQNVILTARVLDKSNGGAVLYERSIVDTPASDPTLNSNQVFAITGMAFAGMVGDPSGAPWTSGTSPWLGVSQYTDGTLPAVEATFDNFELRTYEIPPLGIQRAMRLTWPAPAGVNYTVEGASTVQGPWLPVQDPVLPGFQQKTVPASDNMGFFRLRQAP